MELSQTSTCSILEKLVYPTNVFYRNQVAPYLLIWSTELMIVVTEMKWFPDGSVSVDCVLKHHGLLKDIGWFCS